MHTDRRLDEKRPHVTLFPKGTKFKFQTSKGPAYATVDTWDEGGWIYPEWVHKPEGVDHLPGWFRSTQVQKLEAFPDGIGEG